MKNTEIQTVKVKLMAFGVLTEVLNAKEIISEVPDNTDELKVWLFNKYKPLKELQMIIAVNKKIVQDYTHLYDGDEIALLPPFSGG